ncbi:hypothetical protein RJ640_010997 [Escallonia rubra]|uniref:Protein PLASTID MOVEMENT IMPAIRED 2 n=1 Tax=Escallonia rubra TaxID=112253 RepID=A0AA88RHU5_9ASTE|nr:hypothetical protein RJ640_010997 [Escallonia rubra]
MNGGEFDDRKNIGSVKAALNSYGERFSEGNSPGKKPQMDFSEQSPRKRELHQARRDIGRFSERRRAAESARTRAESDLFYAKKSVRDLSFRIEESNARAKVQIRGLDKLKNPKKREEDENMEDYQYAEVMGELEYIKQELSKLKLDVASVLDDKRRAEKETEASSSRMWSYSSSAEALKKEIEELNDEHVVVELARIEALKEYGAIEARRKEEAEQYSAKAEETRKKVNEIIQETNRAKEIERQLEITNSDVNVLQNQLVLVKEMDRSAQRSESLKHREDSFQKAEKSDPSALKSISEELEAAKKELASIKEEGFQFMASMDIVRNELKHVSEETARLKKTEDKADLTVQNLNAKLLRAKVKLEAVSGAEEKAKTILSNLSLTLEQLKTEALTAKKERELIGEETANFKAEVQRTEFEIDLAEERLQAAMQELEAVKSSEAISLENLKSLTEDTMRARASASEHSSTINIPTFEYEYLTGRAVGAEEIADKKVAAAQAWIEALKASEKEILMKTEMAQREIIELKVEEEEQEEVYRTERPLHGKRVVEDELPIWGKKREKNLEPEDLQLEDASPRVLINRNSISAPARRAKHRKAGSPTARHMSRSTSVKRRRGVTANLAKIITNKYTERDL